ncbi:GNAT family N-acetyltransferase [Arvimicrobium flavum]|uniref:GNAT family N-acetyltransferase n=1 Tax=Arvimicrobium flavum TaxID=3393320 RepID=UPI00237A2D1B|nr:GNAT family N-acetyltransferase [Mesorhizobium shangrilense]
MDSRYHIRPRRESDDDRLAGVETRAAALFSAHGHPEVGNAPASDASSIRTLTDGCDVWVAADRDDAPVGFAVAYQLGGHLHLKELSVDPAHGRRGIGARLVGCVRDAARRRGLPAVSLTTYRDVPFNQPYYERLGFRELPLHEAADELVRCFHREVPPGSSPQSRVLLVCNS